jgi:hypothetical protein
MCMCVVCVFIIGEWFASHTKAVSLSLYLCFFIYFIYTPRSHTYAMVRSSLLRHAEAVNTVKVSGEWYSSLEDIQSKGKAGG